MDGCEFIGVEDGNASVIAAEDLIRICTRVHSIDVVRRACYALAASYWFWLTVVDPEHIDVEIARRDPNEDLLAARRSFGQALIDFGLRAQIETASAGVRAVLVGAALAEARGPQQPSPAAVP